MSRVIEIGNLSGIPPYAKMKTEEEYLEVSDGPYVVGQVVDKQLFCKEFRDYPWVRNVELSCSQRKSFVDGIKEIDEALGFYRPVYIFPEYDQRKVLSNNMPQRGEQVARWHVDNNGTVFTSGKVSSNYIVSSGYGTLYIREKNFGRLELKSGRIQHGIFDDEGSREVEEAATKLGWIETMEPFMIYLVPPKVFHRAQLLPLGTVRTFLRVVIQG